MVLKVFERTLVRGYYLVDHESVFPFATAASAEGWCKDYELVIVRCDFETVTHPPGEVRCCVSISLVDVITYAADSDPKVFGMEHW